LNAPVLFDGRNIYDKEEMHALNFSYYCIGVQSSKGSATNGLQLVV
jgi:UDPglucose 6-dehydrogenase